MSQCEEWNIGVQGKREAIGDHNTFHRTNFMVIHSFIDCWAFSCAANALSQACSRSVSLSSREGRNVCPIFG